MDTLCGEVLWYGDAEFSNTVVTIYSEVKSDDHSNVEGSLRQTVVTEF
jgi:hypothetical protein